MKMKVIYFLAMIFALFLFSVKTFAQAITYQGFECLNAANANDPTPTDTPAESRFEVIEVLDGGMVRLILSGGLPRFVNDGQSICIDKDTAIGFVGIPEAAGSVGLPLRLESIDATGFFNGQDLLISVNSIYTDLSASRGTFSSFRTSRIQPVSNTLIFNYLANANSFALNKIIHNKGFTQTSGSTGSLTPFMETIIPSFGESGVFIVPRILTPPSSIVYRLEN
ncbi:hypothetical protein [Nitrosomonas sp.]|uniref:hypothetical protein n=1 Tax=Nitrosomonas sp. TaxID=42353 RepID=UPI0020851F33|nr:hypothetical protein [Nitrosomonas sp.]GJL75512.1 MAG: hypothetical protein NMNS02_16180 [Nitrosomonas sp.]